MFTPAPSGCATGCADMSVQRLGSPLHDTKRHQSGAAMVMGMILLVLLTLLGLTALGTSVMEERMAANARDRIRAFQAAEAALRSCESSITSSTVFDNSKGFYQPASGSKPRWDTVDWTSEDAVHSHTGSLPLVHSQPRCIAEDLGVDVKESLRVGVANASSANYGYYRVTARGQGASDRTVVMLQTTLKLQK